jgi:hypothetical protein
MLSEVRHVAQNWSSKRFSVRFGDDGGSLKSKVHHYSVQKNSQADVAPNLHVFRENICSREMME